MSSADDLAPNRARWTRANVDDADPSAESSSGRSWPAKEIRVARRR